MDRSIWFLQRGTVMFLGRFTLAFVVALLLTGAAAAQPWSWEHGVTEFSVYHYWHDVFRVHHAEGGLNSALRPAPGERGVAAWWGPQDDEGVLLIVLAVFDHAGEAPPEGSSPLVDVLLIATANRFPPMVWGDHRLEVGTDCLLGFYPGVEEGSIDFPADYGALWDWALSQDGEARVHCVQGGVSIYRLTEGRLQIQYSGQGDGWDLAGRGLNVYPTVTPNETTTFGALKRAWR